MYLYQPCGFDILVLVTDVLVVGTAEEFSEERFEGHFVVADG